MTKSGGSQNGPGDDRSRTAAPDTEGTLPEQVARLILRSFLAQRMQWVGQRIAEMHIPLTLREIADGIGISDHYAHHAVSELVAARAIVVPDSGMRVLDPDGLVDAANIEPRILTQWLFR